MNGRFEPCGYLFTFPIENVHPCETGFNIIKTWWYGEMARCREPRQQCCPYLKGDLVCTPKVSSMEAMPTLAEEDTEYM